MKNIFVCLLTGALSLCAATQAADVETVTVVPKPVTAGSVHYPMMPDEFYKFIQVYTLSNGMELALFSKGPVMYAKLNEQAPERIIATAPNAFQSNNSKLKVRIDLTDNDEVSGEAYIPVRTVNMANSDEQQFVIASLHHINQD